jgi:hypothetical protein
MHQTGELHGLRPVQLPELVCIQYEQNLDRDSPAELENQRLAITYPVGWKRS